jgi:hypothetical protein
MQFLTIGTRKICAIENRNAAAISFDRELIFATDPPYYDNIGYAELSDFFMCGFAERWHRAKFGLICSGVLSLPRLRSLLQPRTATTEQTMLKPFSWTVSRKLCARCEMRALIFQSLFLRI